MLVGVGDEWEPGLTPVPSQLRKTVSPIEILALGRIQTHSFSTVFIGYSRDWLNWKDTVMVEGLLVGNHIQRMVSLHQVQRIYTQYFSHSHYIPPTVQVGARLVDGTHQTGYKI